MLYYCIFQNFPSLRNDPSILRQMSRDAAKTRKDFGAGMSVDDEEDVAFVDYVFLPHFPVHGDVNDGDFQVIKLNIHKFSKTSKATKCFYFCFSG